VHAGFFSVYYLSFLDVKRYSNDEITQKCSSVNDLRTPGVYCEVQLWTIAKVSTDFLHKYKTADIIVCAF
jgi:hypothetical protein